MLHSDFWEKGSILLHVLILIIQMLIKLAHLFHLVLPDVHVLFVLIFIGAEVFIETLQETAVKRLG
jgi:hypothetical protein